MQKNSRTFMTLFIKNAGNLVRIGGILAGLVWLYAPVMKRLVEDWLHMPDFSHGFLIPLISAYIIYRKRDQLSTLTPSGRWLGIGIAAVGVCLLILGRLAGEFFTMRISLLILIGGIIISMLGEGFFRVLLLPLSYLVFMIPLPSILMDRITFPMQLLASRMATASLYLIGIPVVREGNIIHLANASLEVAEACSGIRSLVSLLALSVVFAHFSRGPAWKKGVLIASTFPVAILANMIRVSGTGALAHFYGNCAAQGFFHIFSGWMLFASAFLLLLGIEFVLSRIRR